MEIVVAVLTDDNIPYIGEKYEGIEVKSFHDNILNKWIENNYIIVGYKYHENKSQLILQHLDSISKVFLREGDTIIMKIRRPLVKGISDIEQPGCGGGGGGGR